MKNVPTKTIRTEVFYGYVDRSVEHIINVDSFGCLEVPDVHISRKEQEPPAYRVKVTFEVMEEL